MPLKNWFQALADLCFPPHCLCCATPLPWAGKIEICPTCLPKLDSMTTPHCPVCGVMYAKSGGGSHICGLCLEKKYAFDRARSVFCYNEEIGTLIHSLKFAGKKTGLRTMATLAGNSSLNGLNTPDIIVPVPLHLDKLRSRGFNQSLLLAKVLFPEQKEKIGNYLIRSRPTQPQTGLKGDERRKNVVGAFALPKPETVAGKKICLVDDVFTTGTTVNECAKTLKKAGAASVEVATLAMVVNK
ncbi:MAG: ComF family protein [Thermodesulfobacteriota bacterium]